MNARRTTTKPRKRSRDVANDDDDPVPADIDELRYEMVRRIATFLQDWRRCPLPRCRRARRCAARLPCVILQNEPTPPADEQAAVIADVYHQVKRRIAEFDAAERERSGR